ncbi:hypothetical protein FQA47_006493 [Oryzias melastigma]|uniref:Uncharacterized protein n=1 Tax=Oryzias melastigma TaxID=30732 RepID=A0A834FN44_ORYME|nr:hypothetical protein FQA47_006493 [Oryzias melastigma]
MMQQYGGWLKEGEAEEVTLPKRGRSQQALCWCRSIAAIGTEKKEKHNDTQKNKTQYDV